MKTKEKQACIVEDCGNIASSRGLCQGCNKYVNNLIKKKLTTDDKLVKGGYIFPRKTKHFSVRKEIRKNFFGM